MCQYSRPCEKGKLFITSLRSRRPHRYVFIVAQPRGPGGNPVKVSNEDLQELQREYPTFGGQQELQDLKDRWGFNAQRFMELKDLEPVAVAYMLVGGTLKSAVDNLGMTVSAAANKVRSVHLVVKSKWLTGHV